jgi:glyoxylase-like metal-dependent hydrolase (beta-lactamase superfamily II)
MFSLDIGALRLTSLDDGSFPFPAGEFFAGVPEAGWRAGLQADAAGKIMVGHNCGLIDTERGLILVDSGYGDDTHGGRTGRLLDELGLAGAGPGDVAMVVNTHAHGDHAGRNTLGGDGRPAFPRARYFLARADWEHFNSADGEVHHFTRNFATLAAAGLLTLFDGPLQLAPGVALLPTPGHTPGHTSVLVTSQDRTAQDRTALLLGDVCHHPLHFTHPAWTSRFDTDPSRTVRTRAWLFALARAHDAVVLCPHATAPGFGKVVWRANGYAWAPLDRA